MQAVLTVALAINEVQSNAALAVVQQVRGFCCTCIASAGGKASPHT